MSTVKPEESKRTQMSSSGFQHEDSRKLTGTGKYKFEEKEEEQEDYEDDFEDVIKVNNLLVRKRL